MTVFVCLRSLFFYLLTKSHSSKSLPPSKRDSEWLPSRMGCWCV